MAIRLTAWLEEICATQLLLGNHWLNDENRTRDEYRRTGTRLDPDREWEGLYHDNGSCLDITNETPPGLKCYLTVLQLSPPQLADSHTHLPAQFAPACAAHLLPQLRLRDTILVRKYTLRYTSYGPPSRKLTFIVDAAEWVGNQHATTQPNSTELLPLRSEELVFAFRRLDETRAAQDHTCLCSTSHAGEEAHTAQPAMDQADESSQSASQAHTQHAFGTQMPHQVRSLALEDEPRVLSVKRLEPVLAGNTQREEIHAKAPASRPKPANPADLLRLLHRSNGPTASNITAKSSVQILSNALQKTPEKALQKPRVPSGPVGTQMQTQLPVHVDRSPTQIPEVNAARFTQPTTARKSRNSMEHSRTRATSPTLNRGIEQLKETAPAVLEAEVNHLQSLISGCAWMQDMEFTRESFKVPFDQMSLLRSDSSWHKPLPGQRFPDGNVPIGVLTTLHRMADEAAAMEAAPDSDEEMYEDPSPEFPVESVDPSPASAPEPSQNADIVTSQVSWSRSPSPVPPQLLTRANQQLPPDSSFEAAQRPDNGGMMESVPNLTSVESSNENGNADEEHAPPSSPPVVCDDDIEMEEHVPQGLGEDSMGGANAIQPCRVPSISPPPDSVVQVYETPYAKQKIGQHRAEVRSPSLNKQTPNDTIKHTSSLAIVHRTYSGKEVSDLQEQITIHENGRSGGKIRDNEQSELNELNEDRLNSGCEARTGPSHGVTIPNHAVGKKPYASHQEPESLPTRHTLLQDANHQERPESDAQPAREESNDSVVLAPLTTTVLDHQPQIENVSPQAAFPVPSVAGQGKRKNNDSPTTKNGRHRKRREIKIIGFGNALPASRDVVSSADQSYHETSMRKLPEGRISSPIHEKRTQSPSRAEDGHRVDAMQIDSPGATHGGASAPGMSPRRESLYEEPRMTFSDEAQRSPLDTAASPDMQSRLAPVIETSAPHARSPRPDTSTQAVSEGRSLNVFLSFKAAYPEYTGDAKHFKGQCRQMVQLDEEDKMVPKWQWDDFIIRNRTDFREYALRCVDQGENPEQYHRFYKDSIRDTLYREGIIANRETLLEALHELGDGSPQREPQVQPGIFSRKPKRSRASLPSAFDQSKGALKDRASSISQERTQYSLPAKAQGNRPTHVEEAVASKTRTSAPKAFEKASPSGRSALQAEAYSRVSLDGATSSRVSVNGEASPSTGDQFRDFYFAYKRTTSMTGSTNVSSKKSLGIGRKS